jgi:isopentenyl phosphate kinase
MKQKLTIIKLGGSLLTDKSTPYTASEENISSVARELKECIDSGLIKDLILIHGVGSFGHPPVLKHKLHMGFQHRDQLLAMSETQLSINQYRLLLTQKFIDAGIPVNLMHPSSFCVNEKMKISDIFIKAVQGFLSLGMIPLVGGDMLYDSKMGFSVGGGDQLTVLFAKLFSAENVIFAADVEGIYTKNPRQFQDAELIPYINMNHLSEIIEQTDSSSQKDASGSMKGKLQAILSLRDEIAKGIKVSIISMQKYGNLKSLLGNKGESIRYTSFIV